MAATTTAEADARVRDPAATHHGVVTLEEALAAGLTPDAIRHRVVRGRWRRAVRGVFIVADAPAMPMQAALPACRAGPPGTVASHLTGAA